MQINKMFSLLLTAGLLLFLAACGSTRTVAEPSGDEEQKMTDNYTTETKISEVQNDPVFGDYGRLIFPVDPGYMSGDTLGDLSLTWYHYIDPDKTVEICNYLKEHAAAGDPVFYDIYTEEEKTVDPAKENTGLFIFRGNPGEKFAVCNAGGGFAYVGAMHDSFPHALELSKKGYNAFALIYRPGAQTACEDLARAITFIFEHAEELDIDTSGYSLWGGSAGARMAAYLGTYGPAGFGGDDLPKPGMVVMQYTGHSEYSENDPPTYVCVGTADGIASWQTMEARLEAMSALGIPTEFHAYEGLLHGFGLGTGTVAEGWIEDAVRFWEAQTEEQVMDEELTSFRRNGRNIPEELETIPEEYRSPAEQEGTLVRLEYDTWESFSYEQHSQKLTKTAWVYLPYGYDETQKYNIFYLSHGGWSNEETVLGTDQQPSELKYAVDHAIQEGIMKPLILVCPTYNNTSAQDSGDYSLALQLTDQFHNELINDLVPAAEGKYHTWAEFNTSPETLKASRDHRGFGGFSMGSVNTWHTFQYCLDYFRYFMPMSGNMGDGAWIDAVVRESEWTDGDFFIWTATGTEDFAASGFAGQIRSMVNEYADTFHLADNEIDGNVSYRLQEGGTHGPEASNQYTFNGLLWFWNE